MRYTTRASTTVLVVVDGAFSITSQRSYKRRRKVWKSDPRITTPSFCATIDTGIICNATLFDGIRAGLSTPSKYTDLKLKNALQRGMIAEPPAKGFTIRIMIFFSHVFGNL